VTRPRVRALVLALLALAPLASAGTEDEPEIVDPSDQEWTPTDLLAAWFTAEEGGVRFHVKTMDGSMPERYPGHVYWVSFRVDATPVDAAVGFGDDGRMRGHLGAFPWEARAPRSFDKAANGGVVDLKAERGRPSTWSGVIPWGAVPGLEPGAMLVDLTAGTSYHDETRGEWRVGLDVATSAQAFVARPPQPFFPILVPAWVLPTIVVGATVAGAAGGLVGAAALARRKAVIPPTSPRVVAPPRPAGKRFRRDPLRPIE
jgi:hypothetical protein